MYYRRVVSYAPGGACLLALLGLLLVVAMVQYKQSEYRKQQVIDDFFTSKNAKNSKVHVCMFMVDALVNYVSTGSTRSLQSPLVFSHPTIQHGEPTSSTADERTPLVT